MSETLVILIFLKLYLLTQTLNTIDKYECFSTLKESVRWFIRGTNDFLNVFKTNIHFFRFLTSDFHLIKRRSLPQRDFGISSMCHQGQRIRQGNPGGIKWRLLQNKSLKCLWSTKVNQLKIMGLGDFRILMRCVQLKKN